MVQAVMEFDRSRQVLRIAGQELGAEEVLRLRSSHTPAEDPAFDDLLAFLEEWFSEGEEIVLHTSGSTGNPKEIRALKRAMMESARMTCAALGLRAGMRALLPMNLRYIGAKMMVVRALVAGMELVVRGASGHPFSEDVGKIHFAAIVPLQLYNTLQDVRERARFAKVDRVLVGGGAVDADLARELLPFPNAVYSTYGMTETLSHIALRRLTGKDAGAYYEPLAGISVSLSEDDTLVVDAPMLCSEPLKTNDIAELDGEGRFRVLGRADNVINSGGVKVQVEAVEEAVAKVLHVLFAVTALPDPKLGEEVVLLVERGLDPKTDAEVLAAIQAKLPAYHAPKRILRVKQIPLAGNAKIDRRACRELALHAAGL